MAYAGPTTQPQGDPQLTYQDPIAYIAWLRTKRLDPITIDRMVTERFGPGKTPEQRAKEAAKAKQQQEFGQLGGTLAGLYGAQKLGSLFGSGAGAGAVEMPGMLGGAEALGQTGVATPNLLGAQVVGGAPSGFELSGIGSAGNYYLPALGAIGTIDLLANQRTGGRGYLQGAASGAAMGSYFGPWGAAIGAGLGLGLAGANELFDTNRYKTEGNRLQKLIDQGINIPPELRGAMELRKGRTRQELIAQEEAKVAQGQYGNPEFARSRNEKDLRPEDIWGYSAFFKKYGNDWLGKFSEQERRDIAQKALDAGAVNERRGSIDIDWSKVDAPKPTTPPSAPRPEKKETLRQTLNRKMR
jgi:hypothetical protein